MATNDLSFEQISTLMNSIYNQVTGTSAILPVTTSQFVTQAQTLLKTGYDPIMDAISQVLGRTIFSIRPYSRKFKGLEVTNQRWGNHTRKLNMADVSNENDQRYTLTDGSAIDMYTVNNPTVLQTNFYGQDVFQKHITIYKDQLNGAFTGPDELGSFFSMVMSNMSDNIEQTYEMMARYTILNLIGAVASETSSSAQRVINLVTEFNAFLGLTDTNDKTYDEIKQDALLYEQFIRWCFARIKSISQALTERTIMYHTNPQSEEGTSPTNLPRHTPLRMQRMYILQPFINEIDAIVKSNTYNNEYLSLGEYESVNFWQNPKNPQNIDVFCNYTNALGTVTANATYTNNSTIAVLMDMEAAGMNIYNTWTANTPMNAAGGYYNMFYHWSIRYWNDITENAVIFRLQ